MDIFNKATIVRLRSHHDKYLFADENEVTVCQERNGSAKNARWTVELVEGYEVVRLKSCYRKYLMASSLPLFMGLTGKKVRQNVPRKLDSSVEWQPIREGPQVRLKGRYGLFLRANGRLPPWRNSITNDIPHRSRTQSWILWHVDVLEIRPTITPEPTPPDLNIRPLPTPPTEPEAISRTESFVSAFSMLSPDYDEECSEPFAPSPAKGRMIYYTIADDKRYVKDAEKETSFTFKGKVLAELKDKLVEETGCKDDFIVCSRNTLNGLLYPLRLHLPPNNADMHVVVVPSSSKAARELPTVPGGSLTTT